ncbi:MAG: response regulator transcription factor [Verrucomicrobiae bacterium]|nr:response regulator transcription factor [Verrucomicrobiae bacterium]MCB1085529.1 response regulator transcription factor [Verrucomicrobiae bacterium]
MSDKIPHPKRILIVDDHPIMRFGLARLIDEEPDLSVPWEAGTAREALTLLEQDRPDLVLIDMALPDRNGLELIKDIRAAFEGVQCLAISMHDEELYAERVLRAGGRGYVMKEEAPGKLIQAIRRVLDGGVFLSGKMEARIVELFAGGEKSGSPVERLSDRELEVFRLLGEGHGTREIAGKLGISIRTIDAHRAHIKEKLGLRDATELVHQAVRWVETGQMG